MRLLLISGHGAGDPGATSGGYREADETRKMTRAVAEYLDGLADVTIYPSDRNAFEDSRKGTLQAVAQFAGYDYVLEIHFNAFRQSPQDGKTKGSEIYWVLNQAAARTILDSIVHLGFTDRGTKVDNLAVIHAAAAKGTPAALLEVCFIDDADDMALYTRDRNAVARAIAGGITKAFNLTKEEANEMVIYKTYEEVPDWGKPTVKKLMDKGLLQGTGHGLNLEHNMLRGLVINDRAGLYG